MTGKHGEDLRRAAKEDLGSGASLTDYRKALNGAQDSINSHAEALDTQQPCSIILWFTDGKLDVVPDYIPGRGRRQPGRPRRHMRPGRYSRTLSAHAGTHIIALALFSPKRASSVRRTNNSSER